MPKRSALSVEPSDARQRHPPGAEEGIRDHHRLRDPRLYLLRTARRHRIAEGSPGQRGQPCRPPVGKRLRPDDGQVAPGRTRRAPGAAVELREHASPQPAREGRPHAEHHLAREGEPLDVAQARVRGEAGMGHRERGVEQVGGRILDVWLGPGKQPREQDRHRTRGHGERDQGGGARTASPGGRGRLDARDRDGQVDERKERFRHLRPAHARAGIEARHRHQRDCERHDSPGRAPDTGAQDGGGEQRDQYGAGDEREAGHALVIEHGVEGQARAHQENGGERDAKDPRRGPSHPPRHAGRTPGEGEDDRHQGHQGETRAVHGGEAGDGDGGNRGHQRLLRASRMPGGGRGGLRHAGPLAREAKERWRRSCRPPHRVSSAPLRPPPHPPAAMAAWSALRGRRSPAPSSPGP